jgi:hypothetical protein
MKTTDKNALLPEEAAAFAAAVGDACFAGYYQSSRNAASVYDVVYHVLMNAPLPLCCYPLNVRDVHDGCGAEISHS